MRYSATSALYNLAVPASHPVLLRLLTTTGPTEKFGIAVALARLHDPAALGPLGNSVRNSDADIRNRTAEALGELGLVEGTNALDVLLKDPDPSVREQAQIAIDHIQGQGKQ